MERIYNLLPAVISIMLKVELELYPASHTRPREDKTKSINVHEPRSQCLGYHGTETVTGHGRREYPSNPFLQKITFPLSLMKIKDSSFPSACQCPFLPRRHSFLGRCPRTRPLHQKPPGGYYAHRRRIIGPTEVLDHSYLASEFY